MIALASGSRASCRSASLAGWRMALQMLAASLVVPWVEDPLCRAMGCGDAGVVLSVQRGPDNDTLVRLLWRMKLRS